VAENPEIAAYFKDLAPRGRIRATSGYEAIACSTSQQLRAAPVRKARARRLRILQDPDLKRVLSPYPFTDVHPNGLLLRFHCCVWRCDH
jgi:hypothetical protein